MFKLIFSENLLLDKRQGTCELCYHSRIDHNHKANFVQKMHLDMLSRCRENCCRVGFLGARVTSKYTNISANSKTKPNAFKKK